MTRRLAPLADRLREHRRVFTLALSMGVTPAEAQAVLAGEAAAARARRLDLRLAQPCRAHARHDPPVSLDPPHRPSWRLPYAD